MPERFEIYIVYKRRYINTLPFLSLPALVTIYLHTEFEVLSFTNSKHTIGSQQFDKWVT